MGRNDDRLRIRCGDALPLRLRVLLLEGRRAGVPSSPAVEPAARRLARPSGTPDMGACDRRIIAEPVGC
jgi:hypothetical protein